MTFSKAPEQWKVSSKRASARPSGENEAKEGGKKQIKTSNPLARLITIAVLVVALLATGLWAIVRSGLPQQKLTALTVGSEAVKAVDVNYYYFQTLGNYGLDPADRRPKAT